MCIYVYVYNLFGYRWTYKEFFDRYRMLLPWRRVSPSDVRRMCEMILNSVIKVSCDIQCSSLGCSDH